MIPKHLCRLLHCTSRHELQREFCEFSSEESATARFLGSGTLDPSFGNGLGYVILDVDGTTTRTRESGDSVTLLPDGKILVVGYVSFSNDTWTIGAYLQNADGSQHLNF